MDVVGVDANIIDQPSSSLQFLETISSGTLSVEPPNG